MERWVNAFALMISQSSGEDRLKQSVRALGTLLTCSPSVTRETWRLWEWEEEYLSKREKGLLKMNL